MQTRTHKESSSVSPTSTHIKSNGSDGLRSFSVQRQPEINSSPEQEIPSYSRNAADSLIANVMRSMEEGEDSDDMSLEAGVQTKLTVGAVGDKYEQEADQVAAQVMSMSVTPDASPHVQRIGEEDNPVQRWSLAQSITPVVQRQVDEQVQMRELVQRAFQAGGNEASGDLESRLNASKSGGSALAPEVRAFMEPRFGADFSSVRVHTGGEAVQMNRELGAQAFAHGSDIYFGAGKSPGNNELTAHELTHVVQQTGSIKTLQRDPLPSSTTTTSTTDPQREVAEKILTDITRRGGITVAFYAARGVRSAAEFRRQALQFAEDHRAIGLSGGNVAIGEAMQMNSSVPSLLQTLTQSINDLLARYPDIAGEASHEIAVDTLAIFTHGGTTQLQAGAPSHSEPGTNQWIRNSLGPWVEALVPFLSPSPSVLLYACSVSGAPTTGIPFSSALQQALQEGLEERYGSDAGVAPEVWGHETAGHTTANSRVAGFTGEVGSSVEENLQQLFIRRITERVSEAIGGLPTLTASQQRRFDRAITVAVRRILRSSTGTLDPRNAYIREVPQMGIERVWQDISSSSTPNFSDLDLTSDAQGRVAAGLAEYQLRFSTQLENLISMARSLIT